MKYLILLCAVLFASPAFGQLTTEPTPQISTTQSGYNLDWFGQNQRGYFIEVSEDLVSWSYMPVIEHGTDAPLEYSFSASADNLFLRLRYTEYAVTNPLTEDADDDGIKNWDEIRTGGTGTDPFHKYTNGGDISYYFIDNQGNGLADGFEIESFGSIGTHSAHDDADNDGLSNLAEQKLGTDPTLKDTDGDTLDDGEDAVPNDSLINWPNST